MDAQQALAELTEISSQIQSAVIFDDKGKVAGSTLADEARANELADGAAQLLAHADELKTGDAPLTQLEAATSDGSVFVVVAGKTRIAATTPPEPTVGLVFYDLKSALRSLTPKKRAPARKKPAAAAAPKKKPAARKKKTDAS
jgi:predicted regulator of Ras-like GTPase activity (Roadblock/LC7/MglB family)